MDQINKLVAKVEELATLAMQSLEGREEAIARVGPPLELAGFTKADYLNAFAAKVFPKEWSSMTVEMINGDCLLVVTSTGYFNASNNLR